MSREIKFRLYDSWEDRLINIVGFIFETPTQTRFWYIKNESLVNESIAVHNASIVQYVGLKDKNGVEIYESDVIKTIWQHDGSTNFDYEITGVVTWDEGRAQWGLYVDKGSNAGWYPLCSYEREEFFVDQTEHLGNIYQNSELLNPSS